MKTCKGCKWAEWRRTTAGKLHPGGHGLCKFVIRVPELPEAFWWGPNGTPRPYGGSIDRHSENLNHCAYYARGEAA